MSKRLGVLASVLFLTATALLWTGCSDYRYCYDGPGHEQPYQYGQTSYYGQSTFQHDAACPQTDVEQNYCAPQPNPCCEPACKMLPKCEHPSSNQLCCVDGITVRAANPDFCLLGERYPLEFIVEACDDVCDVIVNADLPPGVSFERSEPEAQVNGKRVSWYFGSLRKGECTGAQIWVRCECEGEQCACFCASATPVRFCSLLCAKPFLECTKCGPEEVCPGDPVHYTISVTNRGSCTAKDVVITDNIPDGLEHSTGQRMISLRVGDLAPCETKCVNLCLKAVKRGKITNTILVTSSNADSASCQWTTCVCCCNVEIVKEGPKEVPVGKNADYLITVINTGDLPLNEVVVTDCAPRATSIVTANGAKINGNQAVWRLRELQPGEKVNLNLTLYTCTPGCFTNRVNVDTCEGCSDCTEFTTRWKGRPALHVCITDTDDPICIGEPTSYCVTVTNQGSESDNNVRVVLHFPDEIVPVAALGDTPGNISGNSVTFAPYNNFAARQTITYRVDARAKKSGDGRVVVEVTSDSITTPIKQQESTIVN